MSEYDKIVPDSVGELEPLGRIEVVRYRVLGYELLGKPVLGPELGLGQFVSVKEAIAWLCEDQEALHQIKIPLAGAKLSGFISRDEDATPPRDVITLTTPTRAGISPSIVANHHAAHSDGRNYLDIITVLELSQSKVFDRGIVWISLPAVGETPSLNFVVRPGSHRLDEVADGITAMLKKINLVINDLLNGMLDTPTREDTLPL